MITPLPAGMRKLNQGTEEGVERFLRVKSTQTS
jgi:hypothetical protein